MFKLASLWTNAAPENIQPRAPLTIAIVDALRTVFDPEARQRLADKWEAELAFYRSANLDFGTEARRREFSNAAERALSLLRRK